MMDWGAEPTADQLMKDQQVRDLVFEADDWAGHDRSMSGVAFSPIINH